MRPDAIDWSDKDDNRGLTFLPRLGLSRVLVRYVALVVVLQCVTSLGVLVAFRWTVPSPLRIVGAEYILGAQDTSTQSMILCAIIAISSGMLIASIIGLPLLRRRMTKWSADVTALHSSIRRLAQGREPFPVSVGGEHEISYLAIAFNDMAAKLLAGRRKLLELNTELEDRVTQRTAELASVNQELEVSNAKLAELTETALRFTDDVAHEFRTPLTVIGEFASIISDGLGGSVTDKQTEYLGFISGAARNMNSLVDDFLDSSKLRAHTLRVTRQPCAVSDLIDDALPMLKSRADHAHVSLEVSIPDDLPDVYADSEKAGRALVNLVVNAIKFSRTGGVVTISAESIESDGVRIAVSDNGPGMTPEETASLFERFRQGTSGQHSHSKGFGLGLSIARELVSLNLGWMSVESTRGLGSTFSFTLPIDDSASIIRWQIERIEERDPNACICALRILTKTGGNLDFISSFIAETTYSRDVQLCTPDNNAILLVGECSAPSRWKSRLENAFAHQCSGDSDNSTLPAVEIVRVSSVSTSLEWLLPHVTEAPIQKECVCH